VLVLLIRFAIEKGISRTWDTSVDLVELLNYFILGITVVVVAIPEGLPLAVTLSLAFSVKKMLLDNNLVRKMEACETMGGANTICSDKTGTLTLNKMTLTSYWNGRRVEFKHHEATLNSNDYMKDMFAELFSVGCCINSTALLRPEVKGSSTEVGIIKLVEQMGYNYDSLREQYPTLLKYPFNSKRKRMSSLIEYKGVKTLLVKGASELVL
jgi:Ca2+ transporting ATPase